MKRPFERSVAVRSLLAVPVGLVVITAIQFAVGGPSAAAFFLLPFFAVLASVPALLLLWTPNALIPVLVVSVLLTMFAFSLFVTGLGHPESFFDFATAITLVGAPLTAAVACVVALRKRKRGTLGSATVRARRVTRAAVGAFVALLALSAVITFVQGRTVSAREGDNVVVTKGDEFSPSSLLVRSGQTVRFVIRNEDSYAHTFTIDGLEIDEYVAPRRDKAITVGFPKTPGRIYELTCRVTGHEAMTGAIAVGD